MNHENERAREYWDRHATRDPLWAVLSDETKRNRGWDLPTFMATGEREIALLVQEVKALGVSIGFDCALDFGCGVGRLTQALARRFSRVVGLDISPEMIRLAQAFNKYPDRVEYHAAESIPLEDFANSVDFVYSMVVLQHVEPERARTHLGDLVKCLRPGGLLVFQLPAVRAAFDRIPQSMPQGAYNAQITVEGPPGPVPPGGRLRITVHITNASRETWSQPSVGAIRLGNHWLDAHGNMLVQDDARVDLPLVLKPEESCAVDLETSMPVARGCDVLELDLVHEGITWFADRGSRPVRLAINTKDSHGAQAGIHHLNASVKGETMLHSETNVPDYTDIRVDALLETAEPTAPVSEFPMHGIPYEEVVDLLTKTGGQVLRAVNDDHAKPEWIGYKYFVLRTP